VEAVKKTKLGTVTFAGRSGQEYEFRVYVWETKFKALPGVYVVASRAVEPGGEPTYEPVFVGTSDNLSKVFRNHPHDECFQLYYANTIAVLQHDDEAARGRVARDLAENLLPPCNEHQVD
jgi:hypothetical protein